MREGLILSAKTCQSVDKILDENPQIDADLLGVTRKSHRKEREVPKDFAAMLSLR